MAPAVTPGLHDLRPRQLHALVLLLVLLPLAPTVLLHHTLRQNARLARETALAQLSGLHAQYLAMLTAPAARALARPSSDPPDSKPERLRLQEFLQSALGGTIEVRVLPRGIASEPMDPTGTGRVPLPPLPLEPPLDAWSVQLLLDPKTLADLTPAQTDGLLDANRLLAVLVLAVALTAGWAITRQIRVHELRNTALAAVAHELKTPVASSRLLLETLAELRHRNPDLVDEYLSLLAGENRRIARIIDNFLTLARMERRQYSYRFEPLPLDEAVRAAVETLGVQLGEPTCRFTLDLPEPPPAVHADRNALRIVLVNLLENAVKYSTPPAEVSLTATQGRRTVTLRVADRGVGIPPSQLRQIFRPFHQADTRLSRNREGCGLGLGIVRRIVRDHGGRIRASNRPGGGAEFVLILPASKPAT